MFGSDVVMLLVMVVVILVMGWHLKINIWKNTAYASLNLVSNTIRTNNLDKKQILLFTGTIHTYKSNPSAINEIR